MGEGIKDNPTALVVMTRVPVAGKTKTRVMPQLNGEECAKLQWAMLQDLSRVLIGVSAQLMVFYCDGPPRVLANTLGTGCYLPQRGENLGERMARAACACFERGFRKVIIIGSDNPTLQTDLIREAEEALEHYQLVLGPTLDGGYYLIGLAKPMPEIFKLTQWGTRSVLEETLALAKQSQIDFSLLNEDADVDTFEDLKLLHSTLVKNKGKLKQFPKNTLAFLHELMDKGRL